MTLVWSGLTLGALYALVAVGYNIVFVSSGAFNFANAQLLMLGTFIAYWGLDVLKWNVGLVFLVSAAIVAAVAGLEERIAIRPVRGVEPQLVTTVGVATLLNGVTALIWGPNALQVPDPTRLEEFRRWYLDVHFPDIMAIGLFQQAELLECSEHEAPQFVAIYQTGGDIAAATSAVRELVPMLEAQDRLIDYVFSGAHELIGTIVVE